MRGQDGAYPRREEGSGRVTRSRASGVCAVVVLFEPDASVVENVNSCMREVDRVFAVDNSTHPGAVSAAIEAAGAEVISLGENEGMGAALNLGCRRAAEEGFAWALTLDQDSTPMPGMAPALALCLSGESGADVAIVAPLLQHEGGATERTEATCVDVPFAVTSGSLLRIAAFEALGGFREDLFIDQVDNEFCLRARRNGWRIVQRRDAVLVHRMGRLERARFPFTFYVTNYSPLRWYYRLRNLLEVKREYGREFPDWAHAEWLQWRKELLKALLAEPGRWRKLRMLVRGWRDYRRGRFGRYEELHSS